MRPEKYRGFILESSEQVLQEACILVGSTLPNGMS